MLSTKYWFPVIVFNFFIASLFGVLMRLAFVHELNWIDYRNLMHGHSHVAMLGWLYVALTLLLVIAFLPGKINTKRYQYLFLLTEGSVIGMAIAFPIQGYSGFSIFFSTVHVFLSYFFIFYFLRDIKSMSQPQPFSVLMIRTAFFFMVLSTLALFTMAPIMILDLKSSNLYYMAVQFFLHFQFNGWFIFGVLSLFFRLLEKYEIPIRKELFAFFYWSLFISCFFTFALAVTWSNPSPLLFMVNSIGVLIQLIALYFLIKILKVSYSSFRGHLKKHVHWLFLIGFIALIIKILVQFAVVIPFLGRIAYTIRNYVIGFIHLILLGAITFLIFGIAAHLKLVDIHQRGIKWGLSILFLGVLFSELLLFLQGTFLWIGYGFIPFYYELIFGVSLLMPLGIALILTNVFSKAGLKFSSLNNTSPI